MFLHFFDIKRYHVLVFIGIVCIITASVLAISLGMTVIQDYDVESVYKKTTCTIRNVEFNDMNPKNEWTRCPWRCTLQHTPDGIKSYCEISEFPCLKIVADVSTKYGLNSVILHENPAKLQKYPDCSTYFCQQDSVVNAKLVNKFKRTYGDIGKKFPCYYNMKSLDYEDEDDAQEHALLKLTYNQASYMNSIFWPCFVALVGILLIIIGFITRTKNREGQRILLKKSYDT
jgi:hypothetical protein